MPDETVDEQVPVDGVEGDDAPDLNQVIADFEAEAAAELETKSKTAAEGDEGKGKGGAPRPITDPDDADEIERIVAENYQGNKKAFVDSYRHQRNENRRLSDEVETLRREVQPPPATRDYAAELETLRKTDPEVLALNRDITDASKNNQAILARQVAIVADADKLRGEIATLDAEASFIDDPKDALRKMGEANRKRSDMVALTNEYNVNELRLEKNSDQIKRDRRELQRADEALQSKLADEANQTRVSEKGGAVTRRAYEAAFDYYTGPLKIDRTSEQGKFAYKAIKAELADHLDSLGEDAEGLDAHGIFEVVKDLVGEYAKAHRLIPAGAPRTTPSGTPPARRVMLPAPPKGARADAAALRAGKASEAILSDPDMVRRRAAAIDRAVSARRRPS